MAKVYYDEYHLVKIGKRILPCPVKGLLLVSQAIV